MNNDQPQKAFEIGDGESFKDDWNLRAQTLGADEVAAFGPSSYKLFAEQFGYVVAQRITSLCSLTSRDRVLDLGCGPGRIAYWIAPKVFTLTGIDVSNVMLDRAVERCGALPNATFKQNNGIDLSEVKDSSVDVVYSFACFIHLPIDVQQGYEKEILRVLRPGGLGLIHVRHNQVLEHTIRTYTGTSYSEERVQELRKLPNVKETKLIPIDRSDDLVENLEHRRWLLIQRK
jgi:ubiquinone/menaquinone biosynthesis C-methylase UbiE